MHVPARGTSAGREEREYIHTYMCLTKGMKRSKATGCDIYTRFLVHNAESRIGTVFFSFSFAPLRSPETFRTTKAALEDAHAESWNVDFLATGLRFRRVLAPASFQNARNWARAHARAFKLSKHSFIHSQNLTKAMVLGARGSTSYYYNFFFFSPEFF